MNIISRFEQNNIIKSYRDSYYLDLNNNSAAESTEIIRDLNNNDLIEAEEVLNFIVNNLRNIPRVNRVTDTLEQISSEHTGRFKDAIAVREEFERVYEQYKIALDNSSSSLIRELRDQLKQIGISAAEHGYHPFDDFNKYYLPEVGLVQAVGSVTFNINGTIRSIEIDRAREMTLPDGGRAAVSSVTFRTDMTIEKVIFADQHQITFFDNGRINKISANQIEYAPGNIIRQITINEPQSLSLPNSTNAMVQGELIFNNFGMLITADLSQPLAFALDQQDNQITVEGRISFNNLGQPIGRLNLSGEQPYEVSLPGSNEYQISQYLELSDESTIIATMLAEPAQLVTAAGDEITVTGEVHFNKDSALIGSVELFQDDAIVTSPDGNRFQAKGKVTFDDNGLLQEVFLTTPRTINLIGGGRYKPVEINGLGFFASGEIQNVYFAQGSAQIPVDFSASDISVKEKVTYNINGKPIDLTLDGPAQINLPSAANDQALVTDIEFYDSGIIKRVTLADNYVATVTLADSQRIKVIEDITFSESGIVTMAIPENSFTVTLPDTLQTVTAINEIYYHDNGAINSITPATPLEYSFDMGLTVLAGVLIYDPQQRLKSIQLFSPAVFEADGRSFNILSIDFDLQRRNVLYFQAAERARGISLDNDFYSGYLITVTRSGNILQINREDF